MNNIEYSAKIKPANGDAINMAEERVDYKF